MKQSLLTLCLLIGYATLVSAQSKILLRSDEVIQITQLVEHDDSTIVYMIDSNRHIIRTKEVKLVVTEREIIYFDKSLWPYHQDDSPYRKVQPAPDPLAYLDTLPVDSVHWILNTSLTSYLEPEPSIQMGTEIWLMNRISVQQRFGYHFNNRLYNDLLGEWDAQKKGFSTRTTLKYYPEKRRDILKGAYVGAEFLYKYIHSERDWSDVWWDWETGEQMENINFETVNKHVFGGHFKAGYQLMTTSKQSLDLFAGIGLKYKLYKETWVQSGTNTDFSSVRNSTRQQLFPSVTGGFLIGFGF